MNTEPKINVPKKTIFFTLNETSINNCQLVNNISLVKGDFLTVCPEEQWILAHFVFWPSLFHSSGTEEAMEKRLSS